MYKTSQSAQHSDHFHQPQPLPTFSVCDTQQAENGLWSAPDFIKKEQLIQCNSGLYHGMFSIASTVLQIEKNQMHAYGEQG